jgi:hypothetical protein
VLKDATGESSLPRQKLKVVEVDEVDKELLKKEERKIREATNKRVTKRNVYINYFSQTIILTLFLHIYNCKIVESSFVESFLFKSLIMITKRMSQSNSNIVADQSLVIQSSKKRKIC